MIFFANNPRLYKGLPCISVFLSCGYTLKLLGELLKEIQMFRDEPSEILISPVWERALASVYFKSTPGGSNVQSCLGSTAIDDVKA